VLVGLRAPDRQHDASAVDQLNVADVEPDDLLGPSTAPPIARQSPGITRGTSGMNAPRFLMLSQLTATATVAFL
jgi:hypothetical protein